MDEGVVSPVVAALVSTLIAGSLGFSLSTFFVDAHVEVAGIEGGYSDHPDDLGGATNYGITEGVARRSGYKGSMKDLPVEMALEIAFEQYWDPLELDHIAEAQDSSYYDVAFRLYDVSFNMGVGTAGRFLQRCLNVLNNQGKYYRDVYIDGKVGNRTLKAFDQFQKRRGKEGSHSLLVCIRGLQSARYIAISESRSANESFTYGWLKRID